MSDKVLFITGASSGIGAATARRAIADGWKVGLFARSAEKLKALKVELGEGAIALVGDARSFEDQQRAVEKLADHFGDVTAAFANAGRGETIADTLSAEPDDWQSMVELNIMGVLWTSKAVAPYFRKNQGHIVITGSDAGRMHFKASVYSATKWFVHGYAGNLAEEFKDWGARVTIISPGIVDTPFFEQSQSGKLQPEDVADCVIFSLDADRRANVREVMITPMK
ncbi:SDR family oxidoreductase [Salinicola rhizosphaerae]|uniref:Short-chain dehydrogenase n=1 Tax=Salinicola rhizosphaerae TaxID=1443141 RepID=A0ABQ3EJT7_9GAMM|nr:SDR family oxidoreductase [Salinicola rhizosphaerae]GHB34646.1 short-chain dehydrogenase [Salinicola rhizosphaerae]